MPPEADKIVLLPRCDAPPHLDSRTVARSLSAFEQKLEPKIAVPMPFGVGESGWVGTLVSPRPPSLNESLAISQKKFLYEVLKVFGNKFRALKISDEPGIGKKTFAAELAHFATVRPPGKGVAEALALDELAGAEVPVRGGGVARPLRRPCACAFGLAAQRQPQYSRRALAHRPCHRVAYSACPCGPPFSLVGHRHLQDPLREDEEADEPPHQRPHGLEEPCRGSQPPWPRRWSCSACARPWTPRRAPRPNKLGKGCESSGEVTDTAECQRVSCGTAPAAPKCAGLKRPEGLWRRGCVPLQARFHQNR